MKKKRWIILLAVGLAAMIAAVWLDPTYILLGLLRNESFYRGRPTSYWRVVFHRAVHGDPEDKIRAHEEMLGIEPTYGQSMDTAAIPVLVELLDDEDEETRFVACNALGARGTEAAPAVPALQRMLHQEGLYRHRNAVKTLASIGPGAKGAILDLIEALKEDDPMVNYFAAAALGRIGPEAREAIPELSKLILSERAKESWLGPGKEFFDGGMDKVGEAASWALKEIAPQAEQNEGS